MNRVIVFCNNCQLEVTLIAGECPECGTNFAEVLPQERIEEELEDWEEEVDEYEY